MNNRACTLSPWFEDPKGFDILFGLDICLFKRAAESNEVWNGIEIDRKLHTGQFTEFRWTGSDFYFGKLFPL